MKSEEKMTNVNTKLVSMLAKCCVGRELHVWFCFMFSFFRPFMVILLTQLKKFVVTYSHMQPEELIQCRHMNSQATHTCDLWNEGKLKVSEFSGKLIMSRGTLLSKRPYYDFIGNTTTKRLSFDSRFTSFRVARTRETSLCDGDPNNVLCKKKLLVIRSTLSSSVFL